MADLLRRRITRRQFLRITAVAGVSVALGGWLIKALVQRAELHRVRETRTQMGTLVTITVVHPDAATARLMVKRFSQEPIRTTLAVLGAAPAAVLLSSPRCQTAGE